MSNANPRQTAAPGSASHQRIIHPGDGKLVPLLVQSFESPIQLAKSRGWTHIGRPQDGISPLVKLTYWIWSSTLKDGSFERSYDTSSLRAVALKWIISWPLMLFLLCVSQDFKVTGSPLIAPKYVPVPIKPEGDAVTRRPEAEDGEEHGLLAPESASQDNIRLTTDLPQVPRTIRSKQFRPRYLCFILDSHDSGKPSFETRNVSKWIEENEGHVDTEYVFVSYTRMQFMVATPEEIATRDYPNEDIRAANMDLARKDRDTLVQWGIDAARAAGKKAFWLDFKCIREDDHVSTCTSASDDVYHICDVVRAAHSMIIAIGPSVSSRIAGAEQKYTVANETYWLQEWGSRLWTLPEILLCPSETRIKLYMIGNPDGPKSVAKRNFAERAWADADEVGMLVDHYEGSVHLTQLQLMGVALGCFSRRKTDQWSQGDIAYALMGLLRQRPPVNKNDSGFQAFARLSLANDSNRLLERLLCILPPRKNAPWHDIQDCWGAKLWDIDTSCHVAKVVDDHTISFDGAYGAAIQWDCLDPPVCVDTCPAGVHIVNMLLFLIPINTLAALLLFFVIKFFPGALGFFVLVASLALTAPATIMEHRKRPFKEVQPRFYGIEGAVEVGSIERQLMGFNHGRLVEVNGPPRQRYHDDSSGAGDETEGERQFTLVDTCTMTITRFSAKRPPVAVFICGKDHGMQRALLCSYDWRSNSFYRETILRMKTVVFAKMDRVDQELRFSITEPPNDQEARHIVESTDEEADLDRRETTTASTMPLEHRSHLILVDLALIPIMMLIHAVPSVFFVLGNRDVPYIIYKSAFIVTQVPAYFLLRRFHIGKMISLPVLVKGVAGLALASHPFNMDRSGVMEVLKGMVDGMILPAFVFLTSSWYTAREFLVRLLIWTSGSYLLSISIAFDISLAFAGFMSVTVYVLSILCILSSVYVFHFVGTPKQVNWLSAYERTLFATLSAAQAYAWSEVLWHKPKLTAIFTDPQTWLIFCISLLGSMLPMFPWPKNEPLFPTLMPVLITIAACIIFHKYRVPKIPAMATALALWTIATPILQAAGKRSFPILEGHYELYLVYPMMLARILMYPLLWTVIALNVADADNRLATMCMALVGSAVGDLVRYLALGDVGVGVYLPLATGEGMLLGGLVGWYAWRNGRRGGGDGAFRYVY